MVFPSPHRFVKEKRPTISPNFNFLGQLLDYEKRIKSQTGAAGPKSKLKLLPLEKPSESVAGPGPVEGAQGSQLPPGPPHGRPAPALSEGAGPRPAPPSTAPDDGPLVQALNGLHLPPDRLEDSGRLKRSFSLDIKSVSPTPGGLSSPEAALELYKPAASSLEGAGKPCQFSPVQEVSEQTPEASPDSEEAPPPRPSDGNGQGARPRPGRPLWSPLHRSGSVEDRGQPRFLFGLSASQQHLATSATGLGLEGWHSDLLAPQTSAPALTKSWYFAPEPPHFYSASAIYGGRTGHPAFSCSQLPTCSGDPGHSVRRRHKPGDRADSRRSWHEESPFEKQFKRRSCQMEFGESIRSENRSREELGKVGSQSSFSGSMEIIEVS